MNKLISLVLLCVLALPGLVRAQGYDVPDGKNTGVIELPIKVANGHILVLANIFNFVGDVETISLEVCLDSSDTLSLHGDVLAFWLEMDADKVKKGESVFVDLVLKPDTKIKIPGREIAVEPQERSGVQFQLTKFYSHLFDEHKLKGSLGRGFFSKYRTVIDLKAKLIRLTPLQQNTPITADTVRSFEIKNGRVCIDVNYADGKVGKMILGSEKYDTFVDADIARALGKPAGDIDHAWLSDPQDSAKIDLSSYLAFRPKSFAKSQDEGLRGAVFSSGVNLLENFRVELDWANSKVGFVRAKTPAYPAGDLDFFKAELLGTADAMQAHLERYPKGRLAPEAAGNLMKWRMADQTVQDDQLMRALQWVIDTSPVERQMEYCTEYVKQFQRAGRSALAARAGDLALEYSRTAITVQDSYRLHNLVGEECLKMERLDDAWGHFLAAAFTPLDEANGVDFENVVHNIKVHMNLGRVYEKQGRLARAYSRYKKAEEKLRERGYLTRYQNISEKDKARLAGDALDLYNIYQEVGGLLKRLSDKIPADVREMLDGE